VVYEEDEMWMVMILNGMVVEGKEVEGAFFLKQEVGA